jgi:Asp/Glu/hydantoin racemase
MSVPHVVFLHAARPSVEPLMQYYPRVWPELRITNLLDDGIMGLFAAGRWDTARERLLAMARVGHEVYGAQAGLVSCSAVSREQMAAFRAASPIPLLKIDEPMAALATATASRLGLLVTFPPTLEIAEQLLREAAGDAPLEIVPLVAPEAIAALLHGDRAGHDARLLAAAEELAGQGIGALVLAQVSMGPLVPVLRERLGIPVFSSLETSVSALQSLL